MTCEPIACARAVAIGGAVGRSRSAAVHPTTVIATTSNTARRAVQGRCRRAARPSEGRRRIGRDTALLLTAVSTHACGPRSRGRRQIRSPWSGRPGPWARISTTQHPALAVRAVRSPRGALPGGAFGRPDRSPRRGPLLGGRRREEARRLLRAPRTVTPFPPGRGRPPARRRQGTSRVGAARPSATCLDSAPYGPASGAAYPIRRKRGGATVQAAALTDPRPRSPSEKPG